MRIPKQHVHRIPTNFTMPDNYERAVPVDRKIGEDGDSSRAAIDLESDAG